MPPVRFACSVLSQRSTVILQTGTSSFGQTPATAAHTSRPPSASRLSAKSLSTWASSVGLDGDRVFELLHQLFRPLGPSVVVDDDAAAFTREGARASAADASRSARNEDALPC